MTNEQYAYMIVVSHPHKIKTAHVFSDRFAALDFAHIMFRLGNIITFFVWSDPYDTYIEISYSPNMY